MTAVRVAAGRTFSSLREHNYRLWFGGQLVSLAGTWMQSVAQAWLVLELTGSGTLLGLVTALQFLPMLLGGPIAGVAVDRLPTRRLLLATQATAGLLALTLGLLTVTGAVALWMVFALAFAFGCVVAVDMPARQRFVSELVGPDDLPNAVTLNSVIVNAARVVGPGIGGVVIATAGVGPCFLLNAASYAAVLTALLAMRRGKLHPQARAPRGRGQLREGLAYVRRTPALAVPLAMMAVIGTLTYEFHVTLPLYARRDFAAGPELFGAMTAAMGGGAVIGGLLAAGGRPSTRRLVWSAAAFGAAVLVLAAAPTRATALAALPLVGAVSIVFISTANATLQLRADPAFRGRVMALYGVAFVGSTPLGGPLVGWVGEQAGGRAALAIGGVAALAAALVGGLAMRRVPTAPVPVGEADVHVATATESATTQHVPHTPPRGLDAGGRLARDVARLGDAAHR